MEYADLVALYERLAATESTNEKRTLLATQFADAGEQLHRLVLLTRGRLYPAYDREELGVSSQSVLAAIAKASGVAETPLRDRWSETGDLGDVAAWAVENGGQQTLFSAPLTVERVHDTLRELPGFDGAGSQDRRVDTVAGLLSNADPEEARYVVRTALGHLRVGVGEGTIRDAIADAFLEGGDEAVDAVERAYQVTTDFQVVARTARDDGRPGLEQLSVELGRPVQVMLAETAEDVPDGVAEVAADGVALCEYKYDGFRVQIHVDGDDISIFTRRLEDVTEQFPDVVRAVQEAVTPARVVLDGELVGYTPETVGAEPQGREPLAFQQLSRRIKRESDIEATARELPVVGHVFDCLYEDGSLLSAPLRERRDRLDDVVTAVSPEPDTGIAGFEIAHFRRMPGDEPTGASELYREALDAGHEGVMLKNPEAAYQPGRRVGRLLKHKPTMEPLDLVVTRAQYSEGRRSQLLGRLFLGCYDPETGDLLEVGRLSTGYTDEELQQLTDSLETLVIGQDGRRVELEPSVVLEVEYEELQESPEYGSGYALRFPRYLRTRDTLAPEDADTIDRVETLYESQ
ncbi:MAG: DNA ligase I, ATP-dependent, dnl1 [halophilic archaeon J07HX64]|jgi:DNA ligase I, ATP-dependent (dnl1)|nr:MAG: DNA ligase I, ATP-dependent, dnl1 [halophilic archaeon J07HX64]